MDIGKNHSPADDDLQVQDVRQDSPRDLDMCVCHHTRVDHSVLPGDGDGFCMDCGPNLCRIFQLATDKVRLVIEFPDGPSMAQWVREMRKSLKLQAEQTPVYRMRTEDIQLTEDSGYVPGYFQLLGPKEASERNRVERATITTRRYI
jgi:hypothetical protein